MTLKYFVLYNLISLSYLFISFGTDPNSSLSFKCKKYSNYYISLILKATQYDKLDI
jgi:hypothetical protein